MGDGYIIEGEHSCSCTAKILENNNPITQDPDPLLFSLDPEPDSTCNNRFIKLFSTWSKYKPESTNSSLK